MNKYLTYSFFWIFTSKIFEALIKFVSLPLLLKHYGKEQYGLIAIAMTTNAYLQLLDMGINTGAIKFYSEWISEKKNALLNSVARTSISFYGIIGIINSCILVLVALFCSKLFNITPVQTSALENMLFILAGFSIINWCNSVFYQLLISVEKIYFIQKINLINNILLFCFVIVSIDNNLTINKYFFGYTLLNSLIILPYIINILKLKVISSITPKFNWQDFKPIFKYSLAIIAMSIFQISAAGLRPIILAIFAQDSASIVVDYRIMETITILIVSIGGTFVTAFLPVASKIYLSNDKSMLDKFVYDSTLYTSIIVSILCFPIILSSSDIIIIYVGQKYTFLSIWLIIWVLTLLVSLHNSPIASLVLASGKTKILVYSSALACVISIIINSVLCKYIAVGSAVIGYVAYIIIQMSCYYFYFNKKQFNLNSWLVFKSFFQPFISGILALIPVWLFFHYTNYFHSLIFVIVSKTIMWLFYFFMFLLFYKTIKLKDLLNVRNIFNKYNRMPFT